MKDLRDRGRDLYFIALIPHTGLREEIREIKERMRDEYGAGHALKSPAHITLQMPFKRSPGDEDFIEVEFDYAAWHRYFSLARLRQHLLHKI